MALSATATQGFELLRYTSKNEVLWMPGDHGDTYTSGDRVVATVGEGVMDPAAANEGGMVGQVQETVVCSAATQAFPRPADFDPPDKSAATKCLIPIKVGVAAGAPIWKVTFANHVDDTVISYTAGTRAIAGTTGHGADDRPNGGFLYVYEGLGAGEVNLAEDYDHTGGAAELLLSCHRPFEATLDATSKYIVLAGEAAASRGVGAFGRCEGASASGLTVNQGADDGDYVVFMSWHEMATALKNLTLHVIDAKYLMAA